MVSWDAVATTWNTILTIWLLFFAFLLSRMTILAKRYENRYGAISTGVSTILVTFLALYNMFVGLFPFPFSGFMTFWIGGCLVVYVSYAVAMWVRDRRNIRQNPEEVNADVLKKIDKSFYKQDISFKMECVRKAFHLMGFLLVLSYYGMGFGAFAGLVNDSVLEFIPDPAVQYESLWGPVSSYPFPITDQTAIASLTLFALTCAFFFAAIPDFLRVLWHTKYNLLDRLTGAVLRGKEYKAAGPQVYLLSGVLFTYVLYHPVGLLTDVGFVMAGALVACFSDAIAAIVGRGWGKHKVTCINGDEKSLEGFVAGVGLTYLIALIFLGPVIAIFAALIFFLLDYFPLPVADNLLNPILIGVGTWAIATLLGLPVGW